MSNARLMIVRISKKTFFLLLASYFYSFGAAQADHLSEKRVMGIQSVYANLPAKNVFPNVGTLNFEAYGKKPYWPSTQVSHPFLGNMLSKPSNIAALVQKNGNLIFERYHPAINSNQPIWGTSMAKTATATVIGNLLCSGKIKSLDDPLGKYSPMLARTVYADVTIKHALQMRSGVSKNREDENIVANKAKGIRKHQNFGTAEQALATYTKPFAKQGKRFSYHVSDTLALSVLAEHVSGESLGSFFYNNIMKNIVQDPYTLWLTDKNGTTVGFGDLVMPARDWLSLGNYVLQQMRSETCLGDFFNDGVKNSQKTGSQNKKYGYQFWVYSSKTGQHMSFHGHFGNVMILDKKRNTVMLLLSLNSNYGSYDVLRDAGKMMDKIASKVD